MANETSKLSDFEIIDRVLNGQIDDFEVLVTRHQSLIASTTMNMLGNMEDAKEIGQRTFIQFYKKLDTFQKKSKVSTFLTRIAINLCLNEIKRNKTFNPRRQPIDNVQRASDYNIAMEFANKDLINNALQRLNIDNKTIITLRMIQGYSTNETADILGIPKGTVLSRLKRAMDKLKNILITEFNYEYR